MNNIKYVTEMMHMVVYFKKLWKSDLKQAWLDYCLINLSRRVNKFIADNLFGKKIILLNKEKICPFANVLSDEFLRETMAMVVIFLWKCQKVISCTIGATLYNNCYSFAAKLPNVLLLVKHMMKDFFFYEQLS